MRYAIRLIVAIVILTSVCHAVESEEDLPGWARYKANPELFESYVDYQRMHLHENMRIMDFPYDFRENHIFQSLDCKHGDIPQRVRLIWWVWEPDPFLRKELLLQWLSEKKEIPGKRDTKTKLRRLLPDRNADSISRRLREVDEVYVRLPDRHRRVQANTIALQHGIDSFASFPILEKMTEEAFFSEDAAVRLRIYQEVYPALRKRRWPESPEHETVNATLLKALYYRESEEANLRHLHTEMIAEYGSVETALEFDDAQAAARETPGDVEEEDGFYYHPIDFLRLEYTPEAWERRGEIGLLEEVRARLEEFREDPEIFQREREELQAERTAAWKKREAERAARREARQAGQ